MLSCCPVQIFRKGFFCDGVCVCVFVPRTWEQLQSRVCVCVFVCVIVFVCVEVCHKTWETECVCLWVMCVGLCVCQGTCVILSWIIADRDCSCPVSWYSPVELWLTMYKRLTSILWHGLVLLQVVTTLVLNVDLLMIFFWHVKGPVGSIYWRQRMFLSCLMIFFYTQNFYNRRGTVYVQIITDIHSHSV